MDELEDIEQLDQDIQEWDTQFEAGMTTLNTQLMDALNELIDRLTLRGRVTTSEEWAANMRTLVIWQATLTETLFRVGFQELLDATLGHVRTIADRVNDYFSNVLDSFSPDPYQALVSQLTDQTRKLVTGTLEATYAKTINDTLTMAVMTKSTAAELRQALTEKLAVQGLSVKPVANVASDALFTFSRAYSQAVAEGMDLKHYYYMGTQIATTRSFCSERFGKAFTQAEVESWPDLTWNGKIPGTNKQTIYWYCGGFRCRHRLLPISKRTYNYLNSQN